jgi:hypothetical protein
MVALLTKRRKIIVLIETISDLYSLRSLNLDPRSGAFVEVGGPWQIHCRRAPGLISRLQMGGASVAWAATSAVARWSLGGSRRRCVHAVIAFTYGHYVEARPKNRGGL